MMLARRHSRGFTIVELLVAITLAALLLAGINGMVSRALVSGDLVGEQSELIKDARFAMQRMTRAVSNTPRLMLPMPDKPDTNWRENVREETVPASPPEGSSTKATAVLAVCLSATVDLDGDGFADADNDRDGRLDEDLPADASFDVAPGIYLIDDGGDGAVDESTSANDDDERLNGNDEDPLNGIDDDVDGVIDEDTGADMNNDNAPGIAGVDDDGDGQIDEGNNDDDDEDGSVDEDWLDTVVFYLQGDALIERHPVPWDENASGSMTGRDFVESTIAERVTLFRVERLVTATPDITLVELTLEVTGESGEVFSLTDRIRVGGTL